MRVDALPGEFSSIVIAILLFRSTISAVEGAVQLRFDPEYSPPLPSLAASRPDLVAAYNRAAFSHTFKKIRVIIEDANGVRITSGPDAELWIQLDTRFAYAIDQYKNAASAGAQAAWASLNHADLQNEGLQAMYEYDRFKMKNAERPFVGNATMHYMANLINSDFYGFKLPPRDLPSVFGGQMPPRLEVN